ncbi:MAG: hypothetical protein DWB56_16945 [Candidatus Jettenia sp.]|uniref:Apea-like HEPN domain-containing protein n=1 Tax=Candidatus Jettenia caeni TaxID=247490 RepID=I3IP70_9BACT|nr:hypothetical protein [Candidatus Jettenia sp. AMX1]MBC6930603.1 hypothetical protein [Candidatus Jettenia sp.]MCE7857807.1 hypothetical protein [Ignavibacteria bacterium CHB3]WKZ15970.1 MAG: hypothetical protein QY317_01430 [Candidatus Jettenia caeni]GJQ44141.1 MAG: hypothetical protein JETCAE03_36390 [Ignavibacteriaceae bacterium]KAA0246696.1 MAG: hypothetical protein EDM77_16515 [Candidatus Jettenia sp. AMX1]
MNDMKAFNIKESLNKLGIILDDIQIVSDGIQGYIVILTSNLVDDDKHKIVDLGFKQINEELWYKPGDVSDEITRDQLFSILERKKDQDFYKNKAEFVKVVSVIWERIVNNFKCACESFREKLQPTYRQVAIACKFKDFVCTNEDEFKIFISYLKQFSSESFKDLKEEEFGKKLKKNFSSHEFYKKLDLRNYFDHDPGKDQNPEIKQEEIRNLYIDLLGKPIARKPVDFYNMQKRLLELCDEWFEEIIKYCEGNYR